MPPSKETGTRRTESGMVGLTIDEGRRADNNEFTTQDNTNTDTKPTYNQDTHQDRVDTLAVHPFAIFTLNCTICLHPLSLCIIGNPHPHPMICVKNNFFSYTKAASNQPKPKQTNLETTILLPSVQILKSRILDRSERRGVLSATDSERERPQYLSIPATTSTHHK
jgi:hypothetical protein